MSETVKMGILVSDATSAEALAFRTYYTEYIQKQYNVELIYSDELKDAAGETGDGVGILTQIPDEYFQKIIKDFTLPQKGMYVLVIHCLSYPVEVRRVIY